MALSAKHKAFINEYLIDFNATRAAQRAGYGGDENTLAVTGSRLLRIDKVDEAINTRLQEKAMRADEVLGRLADQARGTIEDYISFNHAPYPTFTLDLDKARQRGVLHLIKKLKYNTEGHPEIELHDAQAALVQLGKHHKLFTEKVEHDIHGNVAVTTDDLVKARDKAKEAEQKLLG